MTIVLAIAAIAASFLVHIRSGKSDVAYLGSLGVMGAAIGVATLSLFVSP